MTSPTKERERQEQNQQLNQPQQNGAAGASQAAEEHNQSDTAVQQQVKQELQTPQGVEHTRTGRIYTPVVDIFETSNSVVLVAEMPGVDENSVDVTLEKGTLTIYGHVEPHLPAGYTLSYAE